MPCSTPSVVVAPRTSTNSGSSNSGNGGVSAISVNSWIRKYELVRKKVQTQKPAARPLALGSASKSLSSEASGRGIETAVRSMSRYVLGAGASRDFGAQLMRDFLEKARDVYRLSNGKYRQPFDKVDEALAELQVVQSKADIDNLEPCLAHSRWEGCMDGSRDLTQRRM
jgi:hypothetical protein